MLKSSYLRALTSKIKIKSVAVGKEIEGSTPPSVFIGSWNYPRVFVGPLIAPQHGDTSILDTPEHWLVLNKTTEEILKYRLSMVRGKKEIRVTDLYDKTVLKLQEIALAKNSVESQATFKYKPSGLSLSEDHLPYGPSALLADFSVENTYWNSALEKAYYDYDLKASEAIVSLYKRGIKFSQLQKALSVGAFGLKKQRKLVPTRWAITACDSILADNYLDSVRHFEIIDQYLVFEYSSLNNYYAILLLPTAWQFEWMEAFLHVLDNKDVVFSDYETNKGKKEYSSVGGCYYSCKFAILEALERMKRQAGAIVFREAYSGYIPLGVFNVRENVRQAIRQTPKEFMSFREALAYISSKIKLPLSRFVHSSVILKECLEGKQTSLFAYY
ncbi:MAG: Nre family DNA repair protein [Candidatus Bilamarchaeaceae archaeon]